ncbi:hypothetical protein DFP74_3753 [Nocardiopsis sp. Huas11]|uniref:hypothetical protein n=1 Tax=Nocardiopsis sp. Huas11 TaxID=2183912 RepID=UPI000F1F1AEB|nr:hypothetical protein [Nocardiopsis sp. Huas11]RKS08065.1 hypothetical protein DFP74_3753 [Nocardiopsis sp. Huas11]
MNALRRWYGAPLSHLVLMVASFALAGYAGVRLLDGDAVGVAVWFVGAAVLHDLVLVPGYTLIDRGWQAAAGRLARVGHGGRSGRDGRVRAGHDERGRVRLVNHVRVPAAVSALLFVVYFPLILGPSQAYVSKSGLPGDPFAERWLLVCALLFAASAVVGAVRYARRAPADHSG